MSLAFGQVPTVEVRLTKFGNAEGIEQLTFTNLMRDQQGFLWFGTQTGLVRFDGHQFKTYRHEQGNPTTISANFTEGLRERPDGSLLVATKQGIDLYDPKTESFSSSPLAPLKQIDTLQFLGKQTWVSSREGLFLLNQEAELSQVLSAQAAGQIRFMEKTPTNELFIVNGSGFYLFHPVQQILKPISALQSFNPDQVSSVLKSATSSSFWLVVAGRGLLQFDFQFQQLKEIKFFRSLERSTLKSGKNHLWMSSTAGLFRIEEQSGKIEQLLSEDHNEALLAINSVLEDDNGLTWFGCYGHGLFLFDSNTSKMGHFQKNAANEDQFVSNIIRPMVTDKAGTLWLGTTKGLISMDVNTATFKNRSAEILPGLVDAPIPSLFVDEQERLWGIVFPFKAFCHDFSTAHTSYYPLPSTPSAAGSLEAILLRKNGQLWVGTSGAGVYYYEPGGLTVKTFALGNQDGQIKGSATLTLLEDHQQRLWLTTLDGGLFRFDDDSLQFHQYSKTSHGLASNIVITLFEDKRQRLWVGTGDGLSLMLADGTFRNYTKKDGLIDENIYAIRQDEDGFIWVSTNSGLSRFDPEKELFNNLSLEDGLQENEFNSNAAVALANGMLGFGGINGFNLFDPRSAFSTNFPPPGTLITDFLLNNQSVPIGANGPLKQAIPFSDELRLGYREKVFGFEFAAPDARAFKSTRYAYQLDGFDTSWQYPPAGRNFVTYTNLKPGSYVMRVKSANAHGDFGREARLRINLAPHPWLSTSAYFFYAATVFVLVLGFILYQRRQQRILKLMVQQRTAMLANRNDELRATDRIVSTINTVLQPEEVLQALTREIYNHFPGADRVAYVLVDPLTRIFRFAAVYGEDAQKYDDSNVPVKELQRRYAKALQPVAEGVYIAHDCGTQVSLPLMGPKAPASLISLEIRIGQRNDGYLTIANLSSPDIFRSLDVDTLSRVRQHAISALAKARNLADLITAQKALVDNAHATGMAELAMEVMHNIGTQANNAKTSAQTIMESWEQLGNGPALRRLADLFAPGATPPDVNMVHTYLQRQAGKQDASFKKLRGELERLDAHLQAITRDLYAQQKHTHGAKSEPLFLNQIVEEVLDKERYLLQQKGVTLHRNFSCVEAVHGNPAQLKRALTCLFGNALEAMSAVEQPCLTLDISQQENWVNLIIRDNGKGIEAKHLDQVFRPTVSTLEDRRGFGLHYCANALKEMGGKISIHSEGLGKGTEIHCALPLSS